MKKLTVLLLLFAFSLGCLAACNESVSDSSIANVPSEAEVSENAEISQEISVPECKDENILYYDGAIGFVVEYVSVTFGAEERYSSGLANYINGLQGDGDYEEVGPEKFFYVGLRINAEFADRSKLFEFLDGVGFIYDNESNFIFTEDYYNKLDSAENEDAKKAIRREKIQQMLPGVELDNYANWEMMSPCTFHAVGYMNIDMLEALVNNKEFGTYITWLPEPGNLIPWLDAISQ